MNTVNRKQIVTINEECAAAFSLPQEGGCKNDGLIVAPRLRDRTLSYLSVRKDSQAIVERCGDRLITYNISDIQGRYSLYTFICETVKTFYSDDPESLNDLGVTCTEHLFGNLQWDIVGNALIIGCAKLGWFLFRKDGNSYRYVRAFCGSKKIGYYRSYIDCADAVLHEFRAERFFIKNDHLIVFAGFHKEDHWYLYELSLLTMTVSAFYSLGECCDVQYLPSTDQYLLFQISPDHALYDTDDPRSFWKGQVSVCDNTGQPVKAVDFGKQNQREWFPSMAYGENGLYHAWYTNDGPAFSEAYILNTKSEELEVFTFENNFNVFFDAGTGSCILIRNSGESLQIYETDFLLRKIMPVAELKTTALRPRIRFIGRTAEGILLQIAGTVYTVSYDKAERTLTGSSFDAYEPKRASAGIFGLRFLKYGDHYDLLRIYADTKTMDVVFADTTLYTESLPRELFDANGLPDYGRISRWIRENGIEQRDYQFKDDVEATLKHKLGIQPTIDYSLPPKQCFWIGRLVEPD